MTEQQKRKRPVGISKQKKRWILYSTNIRGSILAVSNRPIVEGRKKKWGAVFLRRGSANVNTHMWLIHEDVLSFSRGNLVRIKKLRRRSVGHPYFQIGGGTYRFGENGCGTGDAGWTIQGRRVKLELDDFYEKIILHSKGGCIAYHGWRRTKETATGACQRGWNQEGFLVHRCETVKQCDYLDENCKI